MRRQARSIDRPTMESVAALAGVSKITVSRALRGSDLVRPELRDRIAKVAADAGYRMNVAARSLRTRRTQTIAVVIEHVARVTDPLLLTMIGGLLDVLTPADHAMLLMTREHFIGSSAVGADGVVAIGQGEGGRALDKVAAFGLPIVAWGEPISGVEVPTIGSDNRQGGRLAAEHLLERGRRRMIFLGDPRHPEVRSRLDGVREVLAASEATLVGIFPCAFSVEAGTDAIKAARAADARFDAVIAASDTIAVGACDGLAGEGVACPDEVAVIGYDDTPIASAHRPSLTSIRQDGHAAGRALGLAILAILADETADPVIAPLPVELIVRESSA